MEKREAKIIRPARTLNEAELKEFNAAFDEAQAWAKSVGLTEQDIIDVIREVRQERRKGQRQSA